MLKEMFRHKPYNYIFFNPTTLHPVSKVILIMTIILLLVNSFFISKLLGFSLNLIIFSILLIINREYTNHIFLLLISASFFLSLLYIVDLKNLQLNFDNLDVVIKFLWRYLLIINTFLLSYYLLSKEETFFLLSKFLPERICIIIISVIHLFQLSRGKFEDYLNFLKLRFNKKILLKERIKLLPLLIQNLTISLLNDLQLYEVSFRNKLLGNSCKKKSRIFKYHFRTSDYLTLLSCLLLNTLLIILIIRR